MIKSKRKIIIFAIIIALVAGVSYGQFRLRRASALHVFAEVISYVVTSEQVVALTFDDGPNPEATGLILDILQKYGAFATFFVTGENAERYPELISRIIAEGHELGNHSWDHTRLTYKLPSAVRQQIEKTDAILRYLGYEGDIHFRAPYGHGLLILPYTLMRMGRPHILWSISLCDWASPSPEYMMARLGREIGAGEIILLHDGYTDERRSRQATVELVELIMQRYLEKGYNFVTISNLIDAREDLR